MFINIYPSWFVIIPSSLIGIFLVTSGDNWFIIWTGFELTLFSFLPIFTGGSIIFEGIINYFLTQAGGSSVFVLSFLLTSSHLSSNIITLSMLIKLGLFPFYIWVPLVISTITWYGCTLLLTIQNVGPLCILWGETTYSPNLILSSGSASILVGGLIGYNQSFIRSLISYSSISHSGWIVLSFNSNLGLFLLYIVIYFLLVAALFGVFSTTSIYNVVPSSESLNSWSITSLIILVISGVPPFSIFYLNVSILYYMVGQYLFIPLVLLGTILSTYFYFTLVTPNLTSYWTNNGNNLKTLIPSTIVLTISGPILISF